MSETVSCTALWLPLGPPVVFHQLRRLPIAFEHRGDRWVVISLVEVVAGVRNVAAFFGLLLGLSRGRGHFMGHIVVNPWRSLQMLDRSN